MSDDWYAVTIIIKTEDAEFAGSLLCESGSNGIAEDKGPKGFACLTAYFDAENETPDKIKNIVREAFGSFPPLAEVKIESVTKTTNEWKEKWRQWFKPFEIVSGIIITPTWETYTPKKNEQIITLDPGMAFGTGLHETTKLCAKAIHTLANKNKQNSLLDVGTGSGLLAIIGRKLGINTIAAVENDPDALKVALENLELNGINDIPIANSIEEIHDKFDIVVANILLLTLIQLKIDLISKLNPNGKIILSGITNAQENEVLKKFVPSLKLIDTKRMGEWSCLVFNRR